MHTEVLTQLSKFLGAVPAQVNAWDKKVIDYLASHANIFQRFKTGSDATKWDIYADIKYRGLIH